MTFYAKTAINLKIPYLQFIYARQIEGFQILGCLRSETQGTPHLSQGTPFVRGRNTLAGARAWSAERGWRDGIAQSVVVAGPGVWLQDLQGNGPLAQRAPNHKEHHAIRIRNRWV